MGEYGKTMDKYRELEGIRGIYRETLWIYNDLQIFNEFQLYIVKLC